MERAKALKKKNGGRRSRASEKRRRKTRAAGTDHALFEARESEGRVETKDMKKAEARKRREQIK